MPNKYKKDTEVVENPWRSNVPEIEEWRRESENEEWAVFTVNNTPSESFHIGLAFP